MNLHQKLKTETDFVHKRLEKALDLMRPDLSLDEYKHILKAFYGVYLPLEQALDVSPTKSSWLEEDLKYFEINRDSINLCKNLPKNMENSYKMGVFYVLEGSNLGAMVLSRHFQKLFMLTPDTGMKFFSGYGSQTMDHWKSFLVELETFSKSKYCNEEHVIAGATYTFSLLYDWLIHYK